GGFVSSVNVNSGATLTVSSGGSISNTIINSGGTVFILGGANTNGASFTLSSGSTVDYGSGFTAGRGFGSGATAIFLSGAAANGTTVSAGATEIMSSGATLVSTTVLSGGLLELMNGAIVSGNMNVSSGGTVEIGSGYTISGATISNGQTLEIAAGGTAVNTIVLSGGVLEVLSGGSVSGTTVSSGGTANDVPAITSMVASPTSGALAAGATVSLTVNFNESVTVNTFGGAQVPTLSLNDGGVATYDSVNSTPTAAIFDYTVQSADNTSALSVTKFNLNGATIQDSAANNLITNSFPTNSSGPEIEGTLPSMNVVINGVMGHGAAVQGLNQFLGFGDSNMDSGYFYTHPISLNSSSEAQYQLSVSAGGGIPTTLNGAMNSVLLAQDLGLTAIPIGEAGGTNYAASGATVSGALTNSQAPSVLNQIASYLSGTNNVADPNAIYEITGGGNDAKIAATLSGTTAQDNFMIQEANDLAQGIEQLYAAGARYFVDSNLDGTGNLGKFFNTTLWSDLGSAGIPLLAGQVKQNVINAVDANPSAYGITNTLQPPIGPFTSSNPYSTSNGGADINPTPST